MNDRYSEQLRTFKHLAELLGKELDPTILGRRITVAIGPEVLQTEAGQILVLTVARLLPRVCPNVNFESDSYPALERLRYLLADDEFSASTLSALARLIWEQGEFSAGSQAAGDLVLGIGARGHVSIGIESEAIVLVRDGHAPFSPTVSTGFAGLLGATLTCTRAAQLLYPEVLNESVAAYQRIEVGAFGEVLDGRFLTLDRPFLIGVGAVGCGIIYALIVTGAEGSIVCLDPDEINDSNLMRYVLFDSRHLHMSKAAAAESIAKESNALFQIEPHEQPVSSYLNEDESQREQLRLAISAVDSYEARRNIASLLPMRVLNIGTSPGDFTVSRHAIGDGFACLACLYPPTEVDVRRQAVMAREMNIDEAEVARLLDTKAPLTKEVLDTIAVKRNKPLGFYHGWAGEPLDTFYNKVVCAELPVTTNAGEAIAPFAMGSAMAAFYAAHSLLVSGASLDAGRYFRLDPYANARPFATARRPRPDCQVCGKKVIVQVYQERWS